MTEEKKTIVEESAAKQTPAAPQAIPAIVESTKEAAPVLSQAPPLSPADAKPAVDKASSVVAPTLVDKK